MIKNKKKYFIVKNKLFLWILLALIFFPFACSPPPTSEEEPYDVGIVFTTSKIPPPEGKPDPGVKSKYQIEPNKSFSGTFILDHHIPKKQTYAILALLNYQQIPIHLGRSTSKCHFLNFSPMEEKYLPFKTPHLKRGFYDFTIVAFRDPFNHSLKNDFRWQSDALFYYPQRANLLVGRNKPQRFKLNAQGTLYQNNKELNSIFLKKEATLDLINWSKEKVSPGEKLNYFIHVGNTSSKGITYAIMVFLNYKQIPVTPNGSTVLYGKLEPKERIVIPATLNVPRKKGVYELLALRAVNPFIAQPDKTNKPVDDRIDTTIRTAIVVK